MTSERDQKPPRGQPWKRWPFILTILFLAVAVTLLVLSGLGFIQSSWATTILPGIFASLSAASMVVQILIGIQGPPPPGSGAYLETIPPGVKDDIEWVIIPGGKVTLEDKSTFDAGTRGGTHDIPKFAIAKHPVTNAQYQIFVDAPNGYCNPSWWDYSDEARKWRKKHPQPITTAFVGDDLPRTNISWYDAVAYCRWKSDTTKQKIRLPTELQWQRAACGDNNWLYPWGNKFDPKHLLCNSSVNLKEKSSGPTSVKLYSDVDSCYGVMNLSGNIWEWCLTEWGTDKTGLYGSEQRIIRGGSWSSKSRELLCSTYRDKRNPDSEKDYVGVRLVKVLS